MSLVDEGEDDEEAEKSLDYLYCGIRSPQGGTMICTHESGWTEETTRVLVDVGEVVGDSILGG